MSKQYIARDAQWNRILLVSDVPTFVVDPAGLRTPHPGSPAERRADGRLESVRQFVNTENPLNGADLLRTASACRTWLTASGWAVGRIDPAGLATIRHLRSTLRTLAVHNVESTPADDAWRTLTRIADDHPATIDFDGPLRLRGAGSRLGSFVVDVLSTVAVARLDGTWPLLKACSDPNCRWLVYDRSKNRSVAWCSSGDCGAKARARTYRSRQRDIRGLM
jgi:predicted RNA-binding Zn ribbon-like protein